MNRPKTNTYPKNYEVSIGRVIAGTISPKPWHLVFATQVDIVILKTCDEYSVKFIRDLRSLWYD